MLSNNPSSRFPTSFTRDLTTETSKPFEDEITAPVHGSLKANLNISPFQTQNMDLESILNPLPTPPLSAPRPRKYCNKPYTLEQIHFLQYCRDDLDKLLWPDIVTLYIERFSDSARDVTRQGLQCRYYRTQLYPMLCVEGKPVHDNEGAVILRGITVRYRGQKEGLTVPILDNGRRPIRNEHGSFIMRELTEDELHGPVGSNLRIKYAQYYNLIDRVPELAAEYNWVKSEWRKKAKREGISLQVLDIIDTRLMPAQRHVDLNMVLPCLEQFYHRETIRSE